ncbi:MAG: hypothetical protein KAJ51_17545 [Thermoplasmata archaeon]|nr:hypothetical protein [Thermoplasmata archaeon]
MEKYFKSTLGVLIVIIMVGSAFAGILNNGTRADVTVTFGNGANQIIIPFEYAGSNHESAYFELSVNSTIKSGSFKVKGMEYYGYPSNVTINVGADEDFEWAFRGKGYGSLGYQTEFSNGTKMENVPITNSTFNADLNFILPRNANVDSAYMDVRSGGGNILIVQDGGDGQGANLVIQALESLGYQTTLASSETSLPANWDDPSIYHGICWFGGTSYSTGMPDNTNAGKMVTYVQTGGSVLMTGVGVDSTYYPGSPGGNEVNFLNWVTHHYVGNQWSGGMSGTSSNTYKTTYVINSAHEIFNTPNTLPSSWTGDITYSCSFYYSPSGTLNNGVLQAKAGNPANSALWGDIWTWDGPSYDPNYGRTVLVRHPIARSWRITDQGDMLTPFVQNVINWIIGSKFTLEDCALDVGDAGGPKDWTCDDVFQDSETVGNFANKLDKVLPSLPYFEDSYGNQLVRVPLNFTTTTYGTFILSNLEIEYEYDALVNKKPNGNLSTELNQHIMESFSDPAMIPIMVSTDTSGKVDLFDVKLIYNIPPQLLKPIEEQNVDEDVPSYELLKLSDYFIDTDEDASLLNYTIKSNSEKNKLNVRVNNSEYIETIPIEENWNGDVEVVVAAEDSYGKSAFSNKFLIRVDPVNDEPYPNEERIIPDVTVKQGSIDKSIELENMGYFIDIENDELYFNSSVDPLDEYKGENITAYVNDDNVLCIIPGEYWHGDGVKVWIYADDDKDVNTLEDEGYFCYQEIEVDVIQVKSAPKWDFGGIPDIYRDEDSTKAQLSSCINLKDYIKDADTPLESLNFNVMDKSNDKILVFANSATDCIDLEVPEPNYYGSTTATVRASDKDYYADVTFNVHIVSVNDLPDVEIRSHNDWEEVEGVIEIYGSCFDVEDTVNIVEIKIGYYSWQPTNGINNYSTWNYTWDTTMDDDFDYLIEVRAFDGEDFASTYVNLTVANGINRLPKVTINSPGSNSKVKDTIIIEGTAIDDDGEIENVEIKIGTGRWYAAQGTQNWTYYWDTTTSKDDNYAIYVRASDGTDYSAQRTITLVVDNGITEEDEAGSIEAIFDFFPIIILIIIIIVILIVTLIVVRRRRKTGEDLPKESRVKPDEVTVPKPAPSSSAPMTAVPLDTKTDFALEKMGGYKVAKPLPMEAKPAEPLDSIK